MGKMYYFKDTTIPAWKDAKFNTSQGELSPIIFNHGFSGSNRDYQAHCMEMASHGYLVISMNDNTGNSCSYTEDKEGVSVPFKFPYKAEVADHIKNKEN